MIINQIKYYQFKNDPRFWGLEPVEFEKINLIVGKNASGKSKTIAVINSLSKILSENINISYDAGDYNICFSNKPNERLKLELEYKTKHVIKEKLSINNEILIDRNSDGSGQIKSVEENKMTNFKIPLAELKVARRDEIQYPYLEDLNKWAKNVIAFAFNTDLGKAAFAIKTKNKELNPNFNLKETDRLIELFNIGVLKHNERFKNKIINDFNSIGFNISDIEIGSLISVSLQIVENPDAEIVGLKIKENDREGYTDQNDMSMGMFRALSLIIHFNYYEIENIGGCILIDDIGEGLDYERSTKLINLLVSKAELNENIQLIMSTNDRFVMNSVDLKYWQIIDRIGGKIKYYNIKNSAKIFEDFKFTGLNNFDFFASDFFKKGFQEELPE